MLILGDSIAEGQWDTTGGWVEHVRRDVLARHRMQPSNTRLLNLSIGGNTARDVIERMDHEIHARTHWLQPGGFALVFAVGVNDAGTEDDGSPSSTVEQFTEELAILYAKARAHSPHLVFIGLLPVDEANPAMKRAYSNVRIWLFEQALRTFAQDHDVLHVPLFELFQEKLAAQGGDLLFDGIHPTDEGHAWLYEHIEPVLAPLLNK